MNDWTQLPKVIDGINWATRTFNNRSFAATPQEITVTPQEKEVPKPLRNEKKKPIIIEAMPDKPLPKNYPDYRLLLQRDGLILFSWEIYDDVIKIVWLTSNGAMRKYQVETDDESELATISPKYKYRNGLRFYPGEVPDFIIYTAPPEITVNLRDTFLAMLKDSGVSVNFDYEFTLGKQKAVREMAVYDRIENSKHLTFDEAEFLEAYRQLDDNNKLEFMGYVKNLLFKQEENKTT